MYKNDFCWNPSTCICENSKYLKSLVHDSVIVCDEIRSATDSTWTNVTNAVATNFTSTISINSDEKKVGYKMDYYILHTFLLVTISLFLLLLVFAMIMQNIGQNKKYCRPSNNTKMEKNNDNKIFW